MALLGALIVAVTLFPLDRMRSAAPPDPPSAVRSSDGAAGAVTGSAAEIADLQRRVAASPRNAHLRALLGLSYLQRARETGDPSLYPRAAMLLDQAARLDPQDPDAVLGQGSVALSRHDFRRALALGERALALSHGFSPESYGLVADADIELGRYPVGFAAVQRMIDERPSLAAYARGSYALELQGDLSGAERLMRLAVDAGSGAPENTQWTRVALGNLLLKLGQTADAEREYRHALAILPGYARALAGLGAVAVARGDLAGAEALYKQASDNLPLPELLVSLGDVRAARGDVQGAADAYAVVRVEQRLFAAAGGNNDLELTLFDVNHARGQAEAAALVAPARHALAERPSVYGHDVVAWALYRAGDCAAALPEARAANALGTADPSLRYHLGAISACAGKRDEAITALRAALSANPRFSPLDAPAATRLLTRLQAAG